RFKLALLPCAFILLYSAYGILAGSDDEEDLSQNAIAAARQAQPPSPALAPPTPGARVATPLLLALVCIELSDVPAVFGVTTDPFLALSSNA
ncbi:hypothetical protein EMIHUDRAFT_260222, partial [Emiliania huxleyi CCMP1516]|uniref:Uncharacterized protein n=2 Tax=Emiliania huxleyi TaxID=2903 RepID=A0A0D3KWV4_EMIH1